MLPRYLLLILIMASVVSALGTPEAAEGGIVAFQDAFEHDVVGEPPSSNPPGAPDGDTLDLNPSSGSITVEAVSLPSSIPTFSSVTATRGAGEPRSIGACSSSRVRPAARTTC